MADKAKGEGPEGDKRIEVTIKPPKFEIATLRLVGTVPLVINAFSAKAREQMRAKQKAGSTAKKQKVRDAKDFQAAYEESKHVAREGWCGIPAAAFRNAMISACRLVGFTMTLAKLSVSVEADGFDRVDGVPLVRITKGEPHYAEHYVRNETGVVDLRPRAMWDEGWEAEVRVRWDADQFTAQDVVNLMSRVGQQVGICEGRPDSKRSAGMGWGLFTVQTAPPTTEQRDAA